MKVIKTFLLTCFPLLLTGCAGMGTYHLIYEQGDLEVLQGGTMLKCPKMYSTFRELDVIDYYGHPCDIYIRREVAPHEKKKIDFDTSKLISNP